MSDENVEIAKGWIERWNGGERLLVEDEVDPEAEVFSRFRPEPYRGRDGVRQWIAEIDQQFDEWRLTVEEWLSGSGGVVAAGRLRIRGRTSSLEFEEQVAIVFELRSGRLLRMLLFTDRAEALEAAGLSG